MVRVFPVPIKLSLITIVVCNRSENFGIAVSALNKQVKISLFAFLIVKIEMPDYRQPVLTNYDYFDFDQDHVNRNLLFF